MNEVLGTLYYVFASDEDSQWCEHSEADVYFCFAILMDEIADLFMQAMDDTASGLQGRMKSFVSLLKRHDPKVYEGDHIMLYLEYRNIKISSHLFSNAPSQYSRSKAFNRLSTLYAGSRLYYVENSTWQTRFGCGTVYSLILTGTPFSRIW